MSRRSNFSDIFQEAIRRDLSNIENDLDREAEKEVETDKIIDKAKKEVVNLFGLSAWSRYSRVIEEKLKKELGD